MELIKSLLDFILHLDDNLKMLIANYGTWIYAILFLIIFAETGLVIFPILPGDSLLFVAGAFAASGSLNLFYLMALLFVAAVAGDTVNYLIGRKLGPPVFDLDLSTSRFGKIARVLVKKEHLLKTQAFYEKHGGKTIIFARFIPIIRTFAPFVAGIGTMNYKNFIYYNVIGGLVWIVGLLLLGYFFGNIEIVKKNFELVILGIIFLSLLPPIIEYLRHKLSKK